MAAYDSSRSASPTGSARWVIPPARYWSNPVSSEVTATFLCGHQRRAVERMRRSPYGLVTARKLYGSSPRARSNSADSQKFSLVLDASRSSAIVSSGTSQRSSTSCAVPKTLRSLTCCFTLGARAHSPRLPVHGPGVRLAGAPGTQRRRQGRRDLGPPPLGRDLASAGRPPQTGPGSACPPPAPDT